MRWGWSTGCRWGSSSWRDARELLALAAEIPIVTAARSYPLASANEALADLAAGRVGAPAAVLLPE